MRELPAETWTEFRAKFQFANNRLAEDMAAAAEDVRGLLGQSRERVASIASDKSGPTTVALLECLFHDSVDQLFCDPLGTFENLRPIGRTLSAIEQHRMGVNDLARKLPQVIEISGAELVEFVGPDVRARWRKTWLKRLKSPRPLRLRQIVLANLWGQISSRERIDEAFVRVLSQAGLHLIAAWQLYRRHQLAMLASDDWDAAALAEEQKWWLRTATALSGQIERLVRSYRRWAEASLALLARPVLRRTPQFTERHQDRIVARWEEDLSQWHRQQRAVRATIDLDRRLTRVAREAIQISREALGSLGAEHDEVTRELDRAVGWLEAPQDQPSQEVFPHPKASLLPAEQRARDWIDRVSSRVQECLPGEVETIRTSRVLDRWKKRWRQLDPRSVMLHALEHSGFDAARDGLREGQTEHTALIRDIEQARQVVAFGLEVGRSGDRSDRNLHQESAANALALLQQRREIQIDPLPSAEAGLCRAEVLTLLETHTALEFGQLGLFALLARQSVPRASRNLGQAGLNSVRSAFRALSNLAGRAFQWMAWKLGWERPVAPRLEPLAERTSLSAILDVQFRHRELPALYQRLFSLAPVEDQRFLVGREIEMNGFSRAFSLWQAGQHATVLVAGARGSGKTSLLNCAALVAFQGVPVIRGQFSERIRSPHQMAEFLRDLLQVPAEKDISTALSERRQVVIIEEFERTFLRSMNGFEGLRNFLHLMSDTSASVLWIVSMNRVSFRYLDAVIGLGRSFSHRINAMSVGQEDMTDAIMQRHTLSGLRLQFAPMALGDPRVNRLRRFVGLEQSPRQLFFNALYRQSEGLFRSAFELWMGSIERIEGSVVQMLQPLDPNYKQLETELKTDDLFLLQAVLQHASLTAEESAEVLGIDIEEARCRLERLLALEVLEPEPACPGLRVRPQAGRFVRDALARQNLL
jgi:hypothetical protein